jgi:hypothetical protein
MSSRCVGVRRGDRCDSEEEIRSRLDADGVIYESTDLAAALALLENNGEAGYDIGSLPGLPYRVLRPLPELCGNRRGSSRTGRMCSLG